MVGSSAPTGESPVSDVEPAVGGDQQLRGGALVAEQAVVAGGVAGVGDVVSVVGVTVPVPLLEETIPPCVPLEGMDHGPCGPGVPPGVANPSVAGVSRGGCWIRRRSNRSWKGSECSS